MSTKKIIISILFLIILDQSIKIILNAYFLDTRFSIINSVLEFKPVFNVDYSYLNNLFKLKIGLFPHIVFLLIMQILLIFLWGFFKSAKLSTTLFDVAFIFVEAAFLCGFISFIFWKKGCLDFIYLKPLFVFDFKDLYVDCFLILFLIYLLKDKTKINSCKKSLIGYLRECISIFRKKADNNTTL